MAPPFRQLYPTEEFVWMLRAVQIERCPPEFEFGPQPLTSSGRSRVMYFTVLGREKVNKVESHGVFT